MIRQPSPKINRASLHPVEVGASRHHLGVELVLGSLNPLLADILSNIIVVNFGAELAQEDGIHVEEAVVSCLVVLASFSDGVVRVDVAAMISGKLHAML